MTQPVTIKLGYLTRKTSPNGATFLQGDLGNLRITIIAEPGIQPSETGDFVYSVHTRMVPRALQMQAHRRSLLPDRLPFDFVPAPARANADRPEQDGIQETEPREIVASKPSTKAERLRAAAGDVLARLGPLPVGGDRLDDILTSEPGDECEGEVPLLERPLI